MTKNNKKKDCSENLSDEIIFNATDFSLKFELSRNKADIAFIAKTMEFIEEEVSETHDAILAYTGGQIGVSQDKALNDMLDGFGDIAFLAINGIYKTLRMHQQPHLMATINAATVLDRICETNLAKLQKDGTVKYNSEGKVQKPEGWKAPEFFDLLKS